MRAISFAFTARATLRAIGIAFTARAMLKGDLNGRGFSSTHQRAGSTHPGTTLMGDDEVHSGRHVREGEPAVRIGGGFGNRIRTRTVGVRVTRSALSVALTTRTLTIPTSPRGIAAGRDQTPGTATLALALTATGSIPTLGSFAGSIWTIAGRLDQRHPYVRKRLAVLHHHARDRAVPFGGGRSGNHSTRGGAQHRDGGQSGHPFHQVSHDGSLFP
jgi:hypothetical protein